MCCPNVGAKFRSQYLSHIMPNWGGVSPLRQGDGCAPLDLMDLKKMSAHIACSMKKGKSPKTLCDPSTFEGDETSSMFAQIIPNFWEQLICQPHNMLWQNSQLSKICGMAEMIMNPKSSKFSLAALQMKALFTCQFDLANVVQLTSNFLKSIYGGLVHIPYSWISRK